MRYAQVAENVGRLVETPPTRDEYLHALLLAYGTPKATVARLRKGLLNQAKRPGDVLLKKKVWFRPVEGDLFAAMEALKGDKGTKAHDPRFLIVSDFKQLLALDRKTDDTLDIAISELDTYFDFFLPWAGMEKTKLSNENPADVKAAEKMAKLFDVIKQDNPDYVRDHPHWMNIFLSRLLFCLFAEDTDIFPVNAVCNAIASHTAVDGSDLDAFFTTLFNLLDSEDRAGLPKHLKVFPYVNGGLFRDHYPIPQFSAKARRMIIESGKLTWAEINPDIFGSMFQAVIDPEERHNLGQHYTSVTNIMKVIEPLFLNDFKADLEKAQAVTRGKKQALHRLLDRIANVKIFDPACGSGNFLIIAYKELRRLEMAVFKELQAIEGTFPISRMTVSQFYGIEIADFACETAILALWLAEHQMNLEYKKTFGQTVVSLPLREGAHVTCGNATRIDWESLCPKHDGDEIYVLGNPPYLGARNQRPEQKDDIEAAFSGHKDYKNSDYVTCWFLKGAEYIQQTQIQYAFVSTNSIVQGEQVGYLWPRVFDRGLEIGFAHQSFKWSNNAKGSAGVTCVIVGVRSLSIDSKILYGSSIVKSVANIGPYLTAGRNVYVRKTSVPPRTLPKMVMGTMPRDGGHLILSEAEKDALLTEYPESGVLIRNYMGAQEFLKGSRRWCLWIEDNQLALANAIPPIRLRIQAVYDFRVASKAKTTRGYASIPHMMAQRAHKESPAIMIPEVSSEHRDYIPMGFLDASTVVSNKGQVIYDAEPYLFGLLSSRAHMAWVQRVAGRLETRINYAATLCYNTFPFPRLTATKKQTITMHVGNVLEEREKHSEKTMAQLYDPDKMPDGLREAHHQLDLAVDRLYRSKPFTSDEERLEHLFKLYEEMIASDPRTSGV